MTSIISLGILDVRREFFRYLGVLGSQPDSWDAPGRTVTAVPSVRLVRASGCNNPPPMLKEIRNVLGSDFLISAYKNIIYIKIIKI